MSKFKVIQGDADKSNNISDITRIRDLDKQIGPIEHTLTNKGLVTYAYHYAANGSMRRAEDLLEKVHPAYFNTAIYKDLYEALFCWSAYVAGGKVDTKLQEASEFFLVVKRSLEYFKPLNFRSKAGFVTFYKNYLSMVHYTNMH